MSIWRIYNRDISSLKGKLSDEFLYILVNRGIDTKEKIDYYLNANFENMHDPFLMKDMDIAVDLILDHISKDSHIHICGDYDQDGIASTVILMKGLGEIHKKITYSIPDRTVDGYGINTTMVEEMKKENVDLIITCDNGIVQFDAVNRARELGIDIIVTDHHTIKRDGDKDFLPNANAVINPHREDETYPFENLCGAGVSFKLIQAIYNSIGIEDEKLIPLISYAAMGTVCDVVELKDENRIIVKEGLKELNKLKNPGFKALVQANNWNKDIDIFTLGFVIGPSINASGRLSTARLGVELFLEDNINNCESYAYELVRLNNERKNLTNEGLTRALKIIKEQSIHLNNVIMVNVEPCHESIVGIIAGRIKEKFNKPTLVFTNGLEENTLKGSGRSIKPYNMISKLEDQKDLFLKFGGHKMAAGFSIERSRFYDLNKALNEDSGLSEKDFVEVHYIDIKKDISSIDENFINELSDLEPFGEGNSRPVLADKNINLLSVKILGKNKNVIKLTLLKNNRVLEAINFTKSDEILSYLENKFGNKIYNNYSNQYNLPIDIIYYPTINEFNGNRSIQLNIKDIR